KRWLTATRFTFYLSPNVTRRRTARVLSPIFQTSLQGSSLTIIRSTLHDPLRPAARSPRRPPRCAGRAALPAERPGDQRDRDDGARGHHGGAQDPPRLGPAPPAWSLLPGRIARADGPGLAARGQRHDHTDHRPDADVRPGAPAQGALCPLRPSDG